MVNLEITDFYAQDEVAVPHPRIKGAYQLADIKRTVLEGKLEGKPGVFTAVLHSRSRQLTLSVKEDSAGLSFKRTLRAFQMGLYQLFGQLVANSMRSLDESSGIATWTLPSSLTQDQVDFALHQMKERGLEYE